MPLALGDLKYEGVVGTGAFAVVKRYQILIDGTPVAVKSLTATDADSRHRFNREIELLRDLQPHPNIIALLGVDAREERPSYIMPLADMNLEQFIARHNTQLSDDARAEVFCQIGRALAHAHQRGVLHRDLAPRNVLIFPPTDAPVARVADFGLGRNLDSTSSRGGSIGQGAGHVAYVAPEQRLDLSSATTRSDVYSLGRLLKFILTGRDPDALGASAYAHVVATATMHEPARRYSDAAALLRAFEDMRALASSSPDALDLAGLSRTSRTVDWRVLHDTILSVRPVGHVYYAFLAPVTNYLGATGRLKSYVTGAGPLFAAFVRLYVERLEECMVLTGWPFVAMDEFGQFLYDVHELTNSADARKAAFEGLWMLAYEQDQWSVQKLVKAVLRQGSVPAEVDEALAARIVSARVRVGVGEFAGVVLPPRMRVALTRQQ